jgi:5-methylcytosine-specific restriction endonuclease McrA
MKTSPSKIQYIKDWAERNKEKVRLYKKSWKKRNPDNVKQQRRKNYLTHQEDRILYAKEYRIKNKEKINTYQKSHPRKPANKDYKKSYYLKNSERLKDKSRKYYLDNPKKVKERGKIWCKKNPKKVSFYAKAKRARRLNASGTHTFKQWEELKKEYNYTCQHCKRSEPEIVLTEDHIKPLSKGGSNDIKNIQPLCRSCNSKKHTKIM